MRAAAADLRFPALQTALHFERALHVLLRFRTALIFLAFGITSVVSARQYGPPDASGVWQDPGLVRAAGNFSLILGSLVLAVVLVRHAVARLGPDRESGFE